MKIAVSACLLGEKIRYDGGHKHYRFLTQSLGKYSEYVPFCPEHIAFGTPRPTIRLVNEAGTMRVRSTKTEADVTEALDKTTTEELSRISREPLCGIIFKARSPSCGLGSTKLHRPSGHTESKTSGVFAAKCREAYPLLPMEEEGRLQDMWLRENFIMQLFAYDAFETFKRSDPHMKDLVNFHTRNKFLLLAKDEPIYRELGKIVGNQESLAYDALFEQYELKFKQAIAKKSAIRRNRNVLEHMAGFFKRQLDAREKAILHEQIDDYAAKIVPLITPVTTIAMLAEKYQVGYLLEQTFLHPYPKDLALRSYLDAGR